MINYLDAPTAEGSPISNFEWIVHTFFGVSKFILDYGDVSTDVEEKECKPSTGKAQGRKKHDHSTVRFYKTYTLKKNWVSRANRKKADIRCPAWGVRGHYRHYKNGKTIFIKSYVKGKDRDNYAGKEYSLLPRIS